MLQFDKFNSNDLVLQKHMEDYRSVLNKVSDPDSCLDILTEHINYLQSIKKENQEERNFLKKHPEFNLIQDKILSNIAQTEKYVDQAINLLNNNFESIQEQLSKLAERILKVLDSPNEFDSKHTDKEQKRKIFESLNGEKSLRSAAKMIFKADKFYETTGLDTTSNDLDQKILMQYIMPDEMNVKRWTLVSSWFNSSYDWGMSKEEVEFFGAKNSMQSKFPRGIGNPTMPIDYKMNHNGSLHSDKASAMFSSIMNIVATRIYNSDFDIDSRTKLFNLATKLKPEVIRGLQVHDTGESWTGEVSVGSEVAKFNETASDKEKKAYKEQKDSYEQKCFKMVLKKALSKCSKYHNHDEETLNSLNLIMKDAYHLAENTNGAKNSMIKVVEKIESNLEYTIHGQSLSITFPANKDFNVSYIMKALYGASVNSKSDGQDLASRTEISSNKSTDRFLAKALRKVETNNSNSLKGLIESEKDIHTKKLYEFIYEPLKDMANSVFKLYARKNNVSKQTIELTIRNLENSARSPH